MNLKRTKKENRIPIGETVFIDLTPKSHKNVMQIRSLKRKWIISFLSIFLVCVTSSLVAYFASLITGSALENEMSVQTQIDTQISQYGEINRAIESESRAKVILNNAAGSEIDWSRLVSNIETALPSGTQILSMSVMTGGQDEEENAVAISLNLSSDSTFGYSDSLRSIQYMKAVKDVEIGGLKSTGEGQYRYSMTFAYDNSILTQKYGKDAAK